jgi:YjbE family integral membrane protein
VELYQQAWSLLQIIFIDLVLAGDNAIVVGMAASRVSPAIRTKVIFWGVAGAVVLRIMFAVVATKLLTIVGLTLAGGILLLWVCWKMYREITRSAADEEKAEALLEGKPTVNGNGIKEMSFASALTQIVVADVSMSLDNVLAVAGVAKGQIVILAIGLFVAIVMMALIAAWIARLLTRYRWITWIGLIIILYVALDMVWSGTHQVACQFISEGDCKAGLLHTLYALAS